MHNEMRFEKKEEGKNCKSVECKCDSGWTCRLPELHEDVPASMAPDCRVYKRVFIKNAYGV